METQKYRWVVPAIGLAAALVLGWQSGVSSFGSTQPDTRSGSGETAVALVVVDTKKLFTAQIQKMLGRDDPVAAGEEGDRFAARLEKILAMYAESGYLVVPKDATLATPPGIEVTATVAQALGLPLEEKPSAGGTKDEHGG